MPTLYGYWRSSAAYRVRIVLELKGIAYDQVAIDLRSGAQKAPDYLRRNPQGLVPFFEDGTVGLAQSLAICEYLEETYPEPRLLPRTPVERARVRALCDLVACEIHPLNNLRVLNHLRTDWNFDEEQVLAWYRHWIREGFTLLERELQRTAGSCAFGDAPTLADAFLVPQVYNARRYGCPLEDFPTVVRVDAHLNTLAAFIRARPENQPDAPA
ncbi:Maleylpyruvate isomerase [bacterium HR40]|nr:Maleylpyruvate isomerase [bacterium HR40]